MSRGAFTFTCEGATLAATLDDAPGETGLLIVSGGNEIRSGAFNGQSRLAADLADSGHPVLRFDRRGIGDSDGENLGFQFSAKDLQAALEAFYENAPQVRRVVGFGNCDAASALMLAGGAGCDALVLSNPWTIMPHEGDAPPPPAAVRARYLAKLRQPRELWRLATGGVNLGNLAQGLRSAAVPARARGALVEEMDAGLAGFAGKVRFLIAEQDRTGQIFMERWDRDDPRLSRCPGAGHAYAEPHARDWLRNQLLAALSE